MILFLSVGLYGFRFTRVSVSVLVREKCVTGGGFNVRDLWLSTIKIKVSDYISID